MEFQHTLLSKSTMYKQHLWKGFDFWGDGRHIINRHWRTAMWYSSSFLFIIIVIDYASGYLGERAIIWVHNHPKEGQMVCKDGIDGKGPYLQSRRTCPGSYISSKGERHRNKKAQVWVALQEPVLLRYFRRPQTTIFTASYNYGSETWTLTVAQEMRLDSC